MCAPGKPCTQNGQDCNGDGDCCSGNCDGGSCGDKPMSADEKALIDTDSGNYVLNGIAHDNATGTFYVTGKRWKSIFSGRFVEGGR